jgi:mRNA-degrading endonuclease YafQ of YafQ-DinJ toxin-antitoxin module
MPQTPAQKNKKPEPPISEASAPLYELLITDHYMRRLIKFLKAHPEIKQQYFKTITLLEVNPFHPSLRLHALSGKLAGLYSVSINLSYRITIEFLIQGKQIIPINVGDHDAVY